MDAATARELTVVSRGLRLAVRASGAADGPRVLALHGWLDNAHSFDPLAACLPQWHWAALDLPGHGHSAHRAEDSDYPYLDWVADVVGTLDALGWADATLVGHSMGAGIAALTAATFPQRATRVVLLDGIGPLSGAAAGLPARMARHLLDMARLAARAPARYPSRDAMAACMHRLVPGLSLASARHLAGRGSRPDGDAFVWRVDPRLRAASAGAFTEAQVLACLAAVACPTLLVRPAAGYPVDPDVLAARMAAIAGLRVHRVAGGHHAHMEAPGEVAAAIAAWAAQD